MADTDIWQPGVFRPLLHRVPAGTRPFRLGGITVRFSTCNSPTRSAEDWNPLDTTAQFCPHCLATAIDDSEDR